MIPATHTAHAWISLLLPHLAILTLVLLDLVIRIPVLVDRDRQKEIDIQQNKVSERDTSILDLTRKLKDAERDPAEEHHYVTAQAIIAMLSDVAKTTLGYVWTHEKLFAGDPITKLGKEIRADTNLILNSLDELTAKSLLVKKWGITGNQKEIWWEITPGYKFVLGKLLFS
jgi:hypothetical protein